MMLGTMRKTFAAIAAGMLFATAAFAQSATEVRIPSPLVGIANEPAPKLIVAPRSPVRWPAVPSLSRSGWRTCAS